MTEEEGALLASIEIVKLNLTAGDGKMDEVHKIRLWDKMRALEMLGKNLRLLTEQDDRRY